MTNSLKVNDSLTHRIIGCAMKVHRTMGGGFQEVIYQRCLAIEMKKQGIEFLREQSMPVYYDEFKVGTRRVDFFVDDEVMVEIKACAKLDDEHLVQALNYLQAFKKEKGLLFNFGARSLEYKRLARNKSNLGKFLE